MTHAARRIFVLDLHEALRLIDRRESKRRIDAVRILGAEQPAAQALQLFVRLQHPHQLAPETAALAARQNDHIAQPRKRRLVADDAGKADQLASFVARDDANGIFTSARNCLARNARRPIARCQYPMDNVDVCFRRLLKQDFRHCGPSRR
jgi:hypothetical protein